MKVASTVRRGAAGKGSQDTSPDCLPNFYKGVGGLAGAALAGTADFIAEARPWQRRHGGNLVRLYPFVLSARANLRQRLPLFATYHQRALAIARILREVPGIAVSPDPPHCHMMRVYLRGDADRLLTAAEEIARTERLLLFRRLTPADVPGTCVFELAVGDAAAAVTDEEIRTCFQRLMEIAGA